jgi:asparagine synthase (glutamine-hydrolysing)
MCGISGMFLKHLFTKYQLTNLQFAFFAASRKLDHRGPDRSQCIILSDPINAMIDFKRLSIMDTSTQGDQPFIYDDGDRTVYVMCNGEIYNYNDLCKDHDLHPMSGSDCEVIPLLYKKYGMSYMHTLCNSLNSEHAFMILDVDRLTGDYVMCLSNDRFGVRPLFTAQTDDAFYFASELAGLPCLDDLGAVVERFEPRHYAILEKKDGVLGKLVYHKYFDFNDVVLEISESIADEPLEDQCSQLEYLLTDATVIRLTSDRPYGCLLSGGVDSSLVAALAAKHLKQFEKRLRTFSIGMDGGTDEKFAKMVAEYIDSDHTHITVTEDEFTDSILNVVKTIGSFDITSVRASVGQYQISKWISENTDIKVLLCGDGSDEICGSYKYFHNAPSSKDFHNECIRLLSDIHKYDGLRADRCISYFGIEARFPFLDHRFVTYYLSCDPVIRQPQNGVEKWLLRMSFEKSHILPNAVLFRSKEAFSDGVSSQKRSWYQIVQEKANAIYTDEEYETKKLAYEHCQPISKESLLFRETFCQTYGINKTVSQTIPYYWLPKWCGNIVEPSARVLKVYSN